MKRVKKVNFTTLKPTEYSEFVDKNFVHYTQSIEHYTYRKDKGEHVHLVGIKEGSKVLAACLITEARALKVLKYFYTHRGPVLDFSNQSLVKCFFEGLKKYIKKQKALYILVDPYILENIRDSEGNVLETYDNTRLIKELNRIGYKHQGHTVGYSPLSQIRWLSVLKTKDKNANQLLQAMQYQTRRNIKKTIEMGIQIKTLDISETNEFFKLFRMAEEKHGFKFRDQQYFEEMQKMYPYNSFIKLAYIDLKCYINNLKEKKTQLSLEILNVENDLKISPNSKKKKTKLNQLTREKNNHSAKIKEFKNLMAEEGDILHLAAAYYIYNKDEVYYLSSGSNPKFNYFKGAYSLQWEMINFAINNHIPRYNFYGITGDFSENAEDYGVQQFKKGFNAQVEEYIGDFILTTNKLLYKLYKLKQQIEKIK